MRSNAIKIMVPANSSSARREDDEEGYSQPSERVVSWTDLFTQTRTKVLL